MAAESKLRKFLLMSGRSVLAGKNSESNDFLVESAYRNDTLLHTEKPGSAFVDVGDEPTKEEIKEAAVFCALKSQDWRDNKKDVKVNVFKKSDCYKSGNMIEGTWGVKKYRDTINVKKELILELEKRMREEN